MMIVPWLRLPRPFAAVCVLLLSAAALPLAATAQSSSIDPQAVELLKASTAFVAGQKQFAVDARNSLEVVLASGQKIQFGHTAKLALQRPNKLRAERTGDLVAQTFYYDGKTLTLSNPSDGHYAAVPAPDTIDKALDFAMNTLDVIAPAGDLLRSNAYDVLMTDVTSGFVVGKAVVEGVRCDHLAFRAPHVDWQIWIQEGRQPLPRKLVITTREVVNAPQFEVVLTRWTLNPALDPKTFTFVPAKGAKKVDFMPVGKTAQR